MSLSDAVEFRDIPGWPGYQVTSDARVRSCKVFGRRKSFPGNWHPIKPKLGERGYLNVHLSRENQPSTYIPLHVLVLTAWVCSRPPGMEACHNNDDKTDNRLCNLRWDTRSENSRDIERNGGTYSIRSARQVRGEQNGSAKLRERDSAEIRMLEPYCNQREIAELYGVARVTVSYVLTGKTWRDQR